MADVCLTAPSVLSPISPNESRKRRHGYSDAGDGCGGAWFKRHRTGSSFARRLLHLRGFSVDVRQAEELVRFIDQLPQEMDKVRSFSFFPPPVSFYFFRFLKPKVLFLRDTNQTSPFDAPRPAPITMYHPLVLVDVLTRSYMRGLRALTFPGHFLSFPPRCPPPPLNRTCPTSWRSAATSRTPSDN